MTYQLLCKVKLIDGTLYKKGSLISESTLKLILIEYNWIKVKVHSIS